LVSGGYDAKKTTYKPTFYLITTSAIRQHFLHAKKRVKKTPIRVIKGKKSSLLNTIFTPSWNPFSNVLGNSSQTKSSQCFSNQELLINNYTLNNNQEISNLGTSSSTENKLGKKEQKKRKREKKQSLQQKQIDHKCPICLDALHNNENVVVINETFGECRCTELQNAYHIDCFNLLVSKQITKCPCCRSQFQSHNVLTITFDAINSNNNIKKKKVEKETNQSNRIFENQSSQIVQEQTLDETEYDADKPQQSHDNQSQENSANEEQSHDSEDQSSQETEETTENNASNTETETLINIQGNQQINSNETVLFLQNLVLIQNQQINTLLQQQGLCINFFQQQQNQQLFNVQLKKQQVQSLLNQQQQQITNQLKQTKHLLKKVCNQLLILPKVQHLKLQKNTICNLEKTLLQEKNVVFQQLQSPNYNINLNKQKQVLDNQQSNLDLWRSILEQQQHKILCNYELKAQQRLF